MHKFSEKRSYYINGSIIYVTKVKKDQKENFYHVTFENIATGQLMTVKDEQLHGAIKTVDSTEFFTMWCHFNNWKDRDEEYVIEHCIKVINTLLERKIELHGSNKFEAYDLNHSIEMYNFIYGNKFTQPTDIKDYIHKIDGGYTYDRVFTDYQRKEYDKMSAFYDIFVAEMQKEINKEILEAMKEHVR